MNHPVYIYIYIYIYIYKWHTVKVCQKIDKLHQMPTMNSAIVNHSEVIHKYIGI